VSGQWKPGDVVLVGGSVAIRVDYGNDSAFVDSLGCHWRNEDETSRPLVVIDPEDREQMRLIAECAADGDAAEWRVDMWQRFFRSLAETKVPEPTAPAAIVTDRRDNIWRWLADGDWVCTSGPDIGEYLAWDRLASERGPLKVELP
jgi:hypothetical protein